MSPCQPISPSYTTTQNRMILRRVFHGRSPLSRLIPPVVPPRGRGLAATHPAPPHCHPVVAWTQVQVPVTRQLHDQPHPPATHPTRADTASTLKPEPTP